MTMINPNVLRAVSEVLESHHVTRRRDERMADVVARALDLSDAETQRWLEALSNGCSIEEANRRAGIDSHRGSATLLVTVAQAIGKALGKLSA
jgi:hypothetical protein